MMLKLIILAIFLWIYWLWRRRSYYALLLRIPGPLGFPLLGMAHHLMRKEGILRTFELNIRKYGSPMLSWLGTYPFVVISDPELAQEILTSSKCVNKGRVYRALDSSIGKGLFSLNEPQWNQHRRPLNSAFSYKVLMDFMAIFNDGSDKLLRELNRKITEGEPIHLLPMLQKYSLTMATRTTMGYRGRTKLEEADDFQDILSSYKCVLNALTGMCFAPWLRWSFLRRLFGQHLNYDLSLAKIHQFIRMLLDQHQRKDPETSREDTTTTNQRHFIDFALNQERKGHFNRQDVEAECNVIIFGAFETTANTISHLLILLAMFPDCQEKLHEEVSSSLFDGEIVGDRLKELVYMDLIINESMRLLSPVPIVARETTDSLQLSNGLILPTGVQIAIDIFHLHRRIDIWGPDANTFNPEHFLPSNMRDRHPYAFIPFTKGIRNCIGWQYALILIKVTLSKLILNYRFSTRVRFEDLEFVEDITLKIREMPTIDFHFREQKKNPSKKGQFN